MDGPGILVSLSDRWQPQQGLTQEPDKVNPGIYLGPFVLESLQTSGQGCVRFSTLIVYVNDNLSVSFKKLHLTANTADIQKNKLNCFTMRSKEHV